MVKLTGTQRKIVGTILVVIGIGSMKVGVHGLIHFDMSLEGYEIHFSEESSDSTSVIVSMEANHKFI
ncbi:MAG: hypothetical protein JSV04_08845 [Candidatus Heimdallarchaeota archaeon]|nr:MAG: hypothetical protein JSV04_08845 [Candidatus Heimdallarchaeota archaeon]